MEVLLIILGAIVVLVLWIIIAKWFENAAAEKGYPYDHVFARVFWLGIWGILYIIALPDKTVQRQNDEIIKILTEKKEQKDYYVPEKSVNNQKKYDDELPPM